MKRLLLICPPFAHWSLSSIAIAQIATFLRCRGVSCEEAYLHLELMRLMGRERYGEAIERRRGNAAELLFAEDLHGTLSPAFQEILSVHFGDRAARRNLLERFATRCLLRVREAVPDIIGFTTSHNQLMASLWLARRFKEAGCNATIVFGGAACSDGMGRALLRHYPQVDRVVSGFGEMPLLHLCADNPPPCRFIDQPDPMPFDDLPPPDYHPFLHEAMAAGLAREEIALVVQSARGCWWGEKHHCAFCGVHRRGLVWEEKPGDRVVVDIRTLFERHRCTIVAADCILSRRHLNEVIPQLAAFDEKPSIFLELKVNVTQEQVKELARARVSAQFGIETLSTRLLALLRKGTTGIRALAVLKWSAERGLLAQWNLLHGIPGEGKGDYDAQAAIMEWIPHFPPPRILSPIHFDRYSPYFENPGAFGLSTFRPEATYKEAHPQLADTELSQMAWHFERTDAGPAPEWFPRFHASFERWQERHERGDGLFLHPRKGLFRRRDGEDAFIHLPPRGEHVLGCTHRLMSLDRLKSETGCDDGLLGAMEEEGLLFIEGERALNLTVRMALPD